MSNRVIVSLSVDINSLRNLLGFTPNASSQQVISEWIEGLDANERDGKSIMLIDLKE